MKKIILLLLIVGCVFAQTTADVMANLFRDQPISINWTEKDYKQYFDSNINNLDPIEGIWRRSQTVALNDKILSKQRTQTYIYGIIKDTTTNSIFVQSFVGYIIDAGETNKNIGDLVANYEKIIRNFYQEEIKFYNHTVSNVDFVLEENYLFKTNHISKNLKETKTYQEAGYTTKYEGENINYESYSIRIYPDDSSYNDLNKKNTASTGSGFLLSQTGLVATNYHVIDGGKEIKILFPLQNKSFHANVKLKDESNDIAILQIEDFEYNLISDLDIPYSFSNATQLKVGQDVYTIGYPLGDIMGKSPRSSYGTVSSLYGINDDPRLIQISNPIQPGNSGGGLFNLQGELVGIVVSSLNAQYFYENVGVIPQNVNFAIKVNILRNILGMIPNSEKIIDRKSSMLYLSKEDQNERLNDFIVQIKSSNPR